MKLPGVDLGLNATTVAIGVGAFLFGPAILAAAGGALRSAAKAGIKGGMIAYNKGRLITEEAKESWQDLSAEAKAEMQESQPKAVAAKKSTSK